MNKAKENSIKEKVKSIAQKQGRTFNDVWQEVVLERWLARMSISSYRKNFIFKGAMCLNRYVKLQRETRDLDFLIKNLATSIENIRKYLSEVSIIFLDDGFTFDTVEINLLSHTHMKYPGYSVSVIGKLGSTKTKIFIDIGEGDSVKPSEITMKLLGTDRTPLFEKEIHLWAYPIESIFAEKLETAISRADQNSRMKDYHDLLVLIRTNAVDLERAKLAIKETFKNRGTNIQNIVMTKEQFPIIQNYWNLYLRAVPQAARIDLQGNFQEVIDEINTYLHQLLK